MQTVRLHRIPVQARLTETSLARREKPYLGEIWKGISSGPRIIWHLSTSQKTEKSLNQLLTDEGKFRVNLSPMFVLSYKISLVFFHINALLGVGNANGGSRTGIKPLSDLP